MARVGPQHHKKKKNYFHDIDCGQKIKTMQKQDAIFTVTEKKIVSSHLT